MPKEKELRRSSPTGGGELTLQKILLLKLGDTNKGDDTKNFLVHEKKHNSVNKNVSSAGTLCRSAELPPVVPGRSQPGLSSSRAVQCHCARTFCWRVGITTGRGRWGEHSAVPSVTQARTRGRVTWSQEPEEGWGGSFVSSVGSEPTMSRIPCAQLSPTPLC